MKLKEYRGKIIFEKNGISVPKGVVVSDIKDIDNEIKKLKSDSLVVKAQIFAGGRGKAGAIKKTDKKNVKDIAESLLNKEVKGFVVKELLIEEAVKIDKEFYISVMVNRSSKNFVLVFSQQGGIDIEEQAEKNPESITKIPFLEFDINNAAEKINNAVKCQKFSIQSITDGLRTNQFQRNRKISEHAQEPPTVKPSSNIPPVCDWRFLTDNNIAKKISEIAGLMNKIVSNYDATLVEINPLALSGDKLIALDSKIIIDDNSLYKHKGLEQYKTEEMTDVEKEADKFGINYVELDGNIAVIGNGAGMVMATLDVLEHFGGNAANFLDVGGGATIETMEQCLKIAMKKKPRVVFINIFGGITRCDEIAQGLVNFKENIDVHLVVRMVGTNEMEGKKILEKAGISYFKSMEESAKKAVELAK